MKVVYVSNGGDDKKDGLSAETAVYSWKRAKKVRGGDNSIEIFIAAGAIDRTVDEDDGEDEI